MPSTATPHPFDTYVQRDLQRVRLAEAAMLFAIDRYPALRPASYLRQLDALAERVGRHGPKSCHDRIATLQTVLVEQEGFCGATDDYYDPRNSYLNEVLRRRTGIPISLSLIWLDIAERLGWPMTGVGLPGHFIVRYLVDDEEVLIDPFDGGAVIDRDKCAVIVTAVYGEPVRLTEEHFAPANKREMLARMLNNLRANYLKDEAWYHATCVLRRLLALHPESQELHHELREAGAKWARLN